MTVRGRRDFRRFHRIFIVSRLLLARSISISVLLGLILFGLIDPKEDVLQEGRHLLFCGFPELPFNGPEHDGERKEDNRRPGRSVVCCGRQQRNRRGLHLPSSCTQGRVQVCDRQLRPGQVDERDMQRCAHRGRGQRRLRQSTLVELHDGDDKQPSDERDAHDRSQKLGRHYFPS